MLLSIINAGTVIDHLSTLFMKGTGKAVGGMTVETALQRLKNKGYKYTGKRKEMIELLASEDRFLSAKEIMEQLQENYPGISFDTIYRNLALFKELHLVEETEIRGERYYRFSCFRTGEHHHHFICLGCGKTEPIEGCPAFENLCLPPGYKVTSHKFEVYGNCQACAGGSDSR